MRLNDHIDQRSQHGVSPAFGECLPPSEPPYVCSTQPGRTTYYVCYRTRYEPKKTHISRDNDSIQLLVDELATPSQNYQWVYHLAFLFSIPKYLEFKDSSGIVQLRIGGQQDPDWRSQNPSHGGNYVDKPWRELR